MAARSRGPARNAHRFDRLGDPHLFAGPVRQADALPLEPDAQVRLVRSVALHGGVIAQARKRPLDFGVHKSEQLFHQALDDVKEDFALGKSHFDIQLGKFRLAVGAQVLVAEAPYNLEITIEARNHQKLLEELGGLRQGVIAPVMQAAGHEVVPRAFGR